MESNSIRIRKIATFTAIFIIALFVFQAGRAVQSQSNINWYAPDGNIGLNNDYQNQNQVTAANVKNLEVKWIYPVPAAPTFYAGAEGVITTPSIVDGIVYFITNFNFLVAADARDGPIIWSKNLPIQTFLGANVTAAHHHAFWFSTTLRGKPLVWIF